MNRWHYSLFLPCWLVVTFGTSDTSAQNPGVTARLGLDDHYYNFGAESADGYLSIEFTLAKRRIGKCEVLYRTKLMNSNETTPVRACDYSAQNGILSVDFKKNSVGLVALKGHLTSAKHKVLWQRVLETTLSFGDKRTIRMDARESGHYFLQSKPKCELTFPNERSDELHKFREGPKVLEITIVYARDNEAFIRPWIVEGWKLLTRDTTYAENNEKYRTHLSKTVDILDLLERFSSEERVLCVSYEDVRE